MNLDEESKKGPSFVCFACHGVGHAFRYCPNKDAKTNFLNQVKSGNLVINELKNVYNPSKKIINTFREVPYSHVDYQPAFLPHSYFNSFNPSEFYQHSFVHSQFYQFNQPPNNFYCLERDEPIKIGRRRRRSIKRKHNRSKNESDKFKKQKKLDYAIKNDTVNKSIRDKLDYVVKKDELVYQVKDNKLDYGIIKESSNDDFDKIKINSKSSVFKDSFNINNVNRKIKKKRTKLAKTTLIELNSSCDSSPSSSNSTKSKLDEIKSNELNDKKIKYNELIKNESNEKELINKVNIKKLKRKLKIKKLKNKSKEIELGNSSIDLLDKSNINQLKIELTNNNLIIDMLLNNDDKIEYIDNLIDNLDNKKLDSNTDSISLNNDDDLNYLNDKDYRNLNNDEEQIENNNEQNLCSLCYKKIDENLVIFDNSTYFIIIKSTRPFLENQFIVRNKFHCSSLLSTSALSKEIFKNLKYKFEVDFSLKNKKMIYVECYFKHESKHHFNINCYPIDDKIFNKLTSKLLEWLPQYKGQKAAENNMKFYDKLELDEISKEIQNLSYLLVLFEDKGFIYKFQNEDSEKRFKKTWTEISIAHYLKLNKDYITNPVEQNFEEKVNRCISLRKIFGV